MQKCGLLLGSDPYDNDSDRPIWVHAVSVGEVMATISFIKEIKRKYPGRRVVLSTVTATGNFTARRNVKAADSVIFFPFDFAWVVKRLISRIKPVVFITLETEIWPNFLRELNRQGIPSMIISGRISRKSFKSYYFFRFFFKKVLSYLSYFCMQTQGDAARLIKIGANPERVFVSGNIKFDHQIPAITEDEKENIYRMLHINNKQNIIIAGSTHRGEEEIVIDVYRILKNHIEDLVLIIAPRHPERFDEVADLLKNNDICYERRSCLVDIPPDISCEVILLDTIGELSKIYSIATIVFVGGSLVPVGGHNVLEPAVFRKPVIFGKYMGNFSEISRILKRRNAAVQVENMEDFKDHAMRLFNDREVCRKTGETAFEVIMENSGALKKSMEILERLNV